MRTTRLLVPIATLLVLPSLAGAANCYSIYDAKNLLAFQSTVPPVDLSTRISQAMRDRYPGGHLTIVPDDADCREYRTGPVLSPRFDPGKAPELKDETLQAPLLRGAPAPVTNSQGAARDAVRSGNNLTIPKP